jgi:hypothetical protein
MPVMRRARRPSCPSSSSLSVSGIESVTGPRASTRQSYPGLLAIPIRPITIHHQHRLPEHYFPGHSSLKVIRAERPIAPVTVQTPDAPRGCLLTRVEEFAPVLAVDTHKVSMADSTEGSRQSTKTKLTLQTCLLSPDSRDFPRCLSGAPWLESPWPVSAWESSSSEVEVLIRIPDEHRRRHLRRQVRQWGLKAERGQASARTISPWASRQPWTSP